MKNYELLKEAAKATGKSKFTSRELKEFAAKYDMPANEFYKALRKFNKTPRSARTYWYSCEAAPPVAPAAESTMALATNVTSIKSNDVYVPTVVSEYVKWGQSKNIEKIIKSTEFFPVYISGPSGNGKTMMVEQACARAKANYVRVQITPETDEDDLIGGFRLINGETVFCKGPVIKAMEEGAILLIDEIDRGSNKIMCLQGVLEGKPVLIKKTGEVIHPARGFNVIATANTKGRGSEDGRFAAATIIDEAFLERFVSAIDQPWPTKVTETKIVKNHLNMYDASDDDFADKLTTWASIIRKTFEVDGVEEVVSTRRLCHIAKSFSIFGDRLDAIAMCIARYDEDTTTAFTDLYTKIDAGELTVDEDDESEC
tara:strand:- start:1804 stop:2916 length:1113 start_codon:yes stop_codon:yes gene_type:complete